ncbi:NPCC-domain-containing protein [Thozetella sp. PMI_491]|nr:NPCC-domain-containing protein [Thozetella sp. PMI_491]
MSSATLAHSPRRATPIKQAALPVKESPGNWKHPRLAEIQRRQSRTVFSDKNAKTVAYNAATLAVVLFSRSIVSSVLPADLLKALSVPYAGLIYTALLLLPVVNIVTALMPLVRPADPMEDIPLTPGQRKLLGLPLSKKKDTPDTVYSTPPKYSRTPSLGGTPASNRSYASSPLSGKGSPASAIRLGNSSFSPLPTSPLLKTINGGSNGPRRSSFGSPSPLVANNSGLFAGEVPGTPSPSGGKRSSVALNNKWLYERGRRTSSNSWLHQNLS